MTKEREREREWESERDVLEFAIGISTMYEAGSA